MSRLWSVLHEYSLRPLMILGFVAGLLGIVGYLRAGESLLESLYGTISLFALTYIPPEGANGDAQAPLILQIARFTAPLVTAGTALTALFAVLRNEIDLLRARRMKEHVIVCGAGDRGKQFAIRFHDEGHQVVVIESDPASAELSPLRHRHIPVIVGDATDPSQMKRAKAGRAERIIIVLDGDDTNARSLTSLQAVPVEGRLQHVHCHVGSPSLDAYFTSRTINSYVHPDSTPGERRVEWFNIERLAANVLLNEYFGPTLRARSEVESIGETGGPTPDSAEGIAIVGTSDIARSVLVQAATIWGELKRSAPGLGSTDAEIDRQWPRLPVTVIDEGCEQWVEGIRSMVSGIDEVLEIECLQTPPFASGWDAASVAVVYVTAPDAIEALEIAHYLEAVRSGPAQIVVRAFVGTGDLAAVLEGAEQDESIHMINLIDRTCTVDMVSRGLQQLLAIEDHIYHQGKPGHWPASRAWDHLDPDLQEDSMDAAKHHLEIKVPSLKAELVPTTGANDEVESLRLTGEEIESLAILEHQRWVDLRLAEGWTPAAVEDPQLKQHPDLVTWDDLGGGEPARKATAQDRFRSFVRGLPLMINACGYRLVREEHAPVNRKQVRATTGADLRS